MLNHYKLQHINNFIFQSLGKSAHNLICNFNSGEFFCVSGNLFISTQNTDIYPHILDQNRHMVRTLYFFNVTYHQRDS